MVKYISEDSTRKSSTALCTSAEAKHFIPAWIGYLLVLLFTNKILHIRNIGTSKYIAN
jgi:hypothetical protein